MKIKNLFTLIAAALSIIFFVLSIVFLVNDNETLREVFEISCAVSLTVNLTLNVSIQITSNKSIKKEKTITKEKTINEGYSAKDVTLLMDSYANSIKEFQKENIDAICKIVSEKIKAECIENLTAPREDFVYAFIDSARNITDSELRKIWANIFTNEMKSHSASSITALDVLKRMTSEDAKTFELLCKFSFFEKGNRAVFTKIFQDFFTHTDFLALSDLHLLSPVVVTQYNMNFEPKQENHSLIKNETYILIASNTTDKTINIHEEVYTFTKSANCICNAINCDLELNRMVIIGNYLKSKYKNLVFNIFKYKKVPENSSLFEIDPTTDYLNSTGK